MSARRARLARRPPPRGVRATPVRACWWHKDWPARAGSPRSGPRCSTDTRWRNPSTSTRASGAWRSTAAEQVMRRAHVDCVRVVRVASRTERRVPRRHSGRSRPEHIGKRRMHAFTVEQFDLHPAHRRRRRRGLAWRSGGATRRPSRHPRRAARAGGSRRTRRRRSRGRSQTSGQDRLPYCAS